LYTLRQHTNYQGAVEILCGYRSRAPNKMLRRKNKLVAKDSLHMQGKAVDIRLFDEPLDAAFKAALELKAGGVGYYRKQGFLHLDVGPVRTW
ncbi:MAG: YcbK family protein, partial [Dongiaceae bacterium]